MDKPDPPRKIGKRLPLSLTKALQKTIPFAHTAPRLKFLQKLFIGEGIQDSPKNISLVNFVLHHPLAAQKVQQKYQFRWVVIKQWTKSNQRQVGLIYDATHAILKNESSPIHYFLLNKGDVLKQHTINDTQLLPSLSLPDRYKTLIKNQQPLWQLLGHEKSPSQLNTDPQSTADLETFLKKYTKPTTFVQVVFVSLTEKNKTSLWVESDLDLKKPFYKVIKVYAWTKGNYQTVYSRDPDKSLEHAKKRGQKMEAKFAQYQEKIKQLEEKSQEQADPFQANNASCINLSHSGLNLAYNLGLISTRQDLQAYSDGLADTLASLYVFVDEHHHLRHITYYDREETFSVPVTCYDDMSVASHPHQQRLENQRQEKAAETMLSFWQRVWQRRQYWMDQRQRVLKPLTDYLDELLSADEKKMTSPLSRCKMQLKTIIRVQHLCMFSDQESHLHAIKFYLAHFAYHTVKRFKGVTVKAQSDGTLTMLNIPGLAVINLHTYFGTKSDGDFFAPVLSGYNPSSTVVDHQNKHLERQSYPEKKHTTLWMHCQQTGRQCAQYLVDYWKTFCRKMLAHFFFEVHGQTNLPSASYLAFQCIWTAYAQKAGPMAQGLEKCKPYYECLLRENSKGGFMFSVEDALDQGDALWPNLPDSSIAQAIAEIDLVSAYGYAASRCYIPTGFCTGFKKSRYLSHTLEKLDQKSRYKTFEFRAVYRVLHHLIYKEEVAIRSVYSNFSPLGLFCLGSYPIDLVVVTEAGNILLYQMDGQWTHGCPAGCEDIGRYAGNQTIQQVRKKTKQRDQATMAWMHAINKNSTNKQRTQPRVCYEIVYNCHSTGFSSGSLDYYFHNTPELAQMLLGYHVVDGLGNTLTPKKLELLMNSFPGKNFTFIAKATLSVFSHPEELFHPQDSLVVYQPRQDQYTRQFLSNSGSVILTRDYYEWLKDSFDSVQLQELEWVLFYKTEPLFNHLYDGLIQLRSSTQDIVLASFLKRMINLSCGLFGAHTRENSKTTYRLVDGPPRNYQFFRHHFDLEYTGNVGKLSFMLLETKALSKGTLYQKVSSSAIPMFVCIIEYGKLRLMQVLNFLQRHISPSQFRLLYSNIDNLVFSLGNADTLIEAIHPRRLNSFHAEKNQFLVEENGTKSPGKAELEWIRNGSCGWKFISLRTQHYCLVVSNDDQGHLHKTAGWNHLSSLEAYALAKQLWAGHQIKLNQTRRVNKKCNMNTHQVEFTYGPKPL